MRPYSTATQRKQSIPAFIAPEQRLPFAPISSATAGGKHVKRRGLALRHQIALKSAPRESPLQHRLDRHELRPVPRHRDERRERKLRLFCRCDRGQLALISAIEASVLTRRQSHVQPRDVGCDELRCQAGQLATFLINEAADRTVQFDLDHHSCDVASVLSRAVERQVHLRWAAPSPPRR